MAIQVTSEYQNSLLNPMIVGISGTNGSGKDTLGELFEEEFNYLFVSVSDILREEARSRGLKPDRFALRTISAEWRREAGMGVLIDKALEKYHSSGVTKSGIAIASLRNPGEVNRVHELGGKVIWLDGDPKVRYERIKSSSRGRDDEDEVTFEQFLEHEQAEMKHSGDKATLNMSGVKELADFEIINSSVGIPQFKKDASGQIRKHI